MDNALNQIFISKFNPQNLGFIDLKAILDASAKVGFTIKKNISKNNNGYYSFLTIYISNEEFDKATDSKKSLNINLYYGKEVEGGVQLRQNVNLKDPIDVRFPDEYYYDISNGEFYNKNKKINANKLLEEVYAKHVKSTKFVRGFYIRSKIWIYRVFLNLIFKGLSNLFSFFIRLISGDVYRYGFPEHVDKILKREKKMEREKPVIVDSEKVSFLGYTATPACIMFYSMFHFILFGILYWLKMKPVFVETIFKNGFLTLIYVMVSLIFIDKTLPKWFRIIVDWSFDLSVNFSSKAIKI